MSTYIQQILSQRCYTHLVIPGKKQLAAWTGAFGEAYTKRNDLSISAMEHQHKVFLGKTFGELFVELIGKRSFRRILEVGCNVGKKLEILSRETDAALYGVEPQRRAVKTAHMRLPSFNIIEGTAYDLPFKDNFFDVVFTSVVLIHIPPNARKQAMQEVARVSSRYIAGFEYWEKKPTTVVYRGEKDLLWKADFPREYLRHVKGLALVKERVLPFKKEAFGKEGLFFNCFLLKKRAA